MNKIIITLLFIMIAAGAAAAQAAKPWAEWTKSDVDKMLNSSAWAHTVTDTDTSEMNVTMGVQQKTDGSTNQAVSSSYHIRFFSAKPVREAFARQVMLGNPKVQAAQLQNFVNGDYSDSIVVAVTYECLDRRYLAQIENAFGGATTENLKGKVYLEAKDGKRVLMSEYVPKGSDGTGAKFVFPRLVDGKPFLTADSDNFRFVAIMASGVQTQWRFKLKDMMYDGKLEF